MIRVGIIGTGFMARAHVEASRRTGLAQVVAIAGSDEAHTRATAARLGIDAFHTDYRELLADPEITAIHNCTANHMHFRVNRDALAAHKHVLCEKPLCTTVVEADELVARANTSTLVLAVNFNYRHYPLVQHLRELVHGGALGRVHLVHGHYLQDWLLYEDDFNWRLLPELVGPSRAFADLGSHWIDLIQYLLDARVTSVCADWSTLHGIRRRGVGQSALADGRAHSGTALNIETEDFGSVLLHLDNGTRACLTVSQVNAGHKNALSVDLAGARGSAKWEQEHAQQLWLGYRSQPNQTVGDSPELLRTPAQAASRYPGGHAEGWHDALTTGVQAFYRQVAEGAGGNTQRSAVASWEDGRAVVQVVSAIIASARERAWVDVDHMRT
jgi:predicted dehydrogenase